MASILLQATNADDMITKALEHGTLSAAQVHSPEHSDHVYVPIQWSIRVVERSQHFLLLARHFLPSAIQSLLWPSVCYACIMYEVHRHA
jgi:hypothetical protein